MKRKIKLVVGDLDGTLLSDDKSICDKNLRAVQDLKQSGILFTIATGRALIMAEQYIDLLSLKTLAAGYNGGLIRNLKTNEDMCVRYFSPAAVEAFLRFADGRIKNFFVYTRDCVYADPNSEYVKRFYMYNTIAKNTGGRSALIYPLTDFLKNANNIPVLKFGVQHSDIDELHGWITELEGMGIFEVSNSMPTFLEIMPAGVSKGFAIKQFAEFYHVSLDEIAVFGDEVNDIPMFQAAGVSFVMGSARNEMKQYGDYIVGSNNDGGFADAVWSYIL